MLFACGSINHDYTAGFFVTEGASRWLENMEIKYTSPGFAAQQMDRYMISGCRAHVKKTHGGMYHIPITAVSI